MKTESLKRIMKIIARLQLPIIKELQERIDKLEKIINLGANSLTLSSFGFVKNNEEWFISGERISNYKSNKRTLYQVELSSGRLSSINYFQLKDYDKSRYASKVNHGKRIRKEKISFFWLNKRLN